MRVQITDIHPKDAFFKHPNKDKIIGSTGTANIFEKSVLDSNYITFDFVLDNPNGIAYGDTIFFFIAAKFTKIK